MAGKAWFGFMCCLWLAAMALGCRQEHYFGPYRLEVPTELMEQATGRTFRFPLDDEDIEQQAALESCRQQPQPDTPCICDFPVLTVNEQQTRLDYRLSLLAGDRTSILVWVGVEVEPDEPAWEMLPDLPWVEVIGEHHHTLVGTGSLMDASFLEAEMEEIDLLYALSRHADCQQEAGSLPAPVKLLFGLALESDQPARVSLEFTFRLRESD